MRIFYCTCAFCSFIIDVIIIMHGMGSFKAYSWNFMFVHPLFVVATELLLSSSFLLFSVVLVLFEQMDEIPPIGFCISSLSFSLFRQISSHSTLDPTECGTAGDYYWNLQSPGDVLRAQSRSGGARRHHMNICQWLNKEMFMVPLDSVS